MVEVCREKTSSIAIVRAGANPFTRCWSITVPAVAMSEFALMAIQPVWTMSGPICRQPKVEADVMAMSVIRTCFREKAEERSVDEV